MYQMGTNYSSTALSKPKIFTTFELLLVKLFSSHLPSPRHFNLLMFYDIS